jgi:type II secretory pathway pseudopilin PulG
MNLKFQTADVPGRAVSPLTAAAGAHGVTRPTITIRNPQSAIYNCPAFTLVEVMVVAAMLGLIVLALMAVFNGTQTAFRAGITQTGVQESGRAVMDLVKSDLEGMTPSLGTNYGAVNFYVNNVSTNIQSLPGSVSGQLRTNMLENFFILTRQNRTWTGVGYVVDTASQPADSLYRFSMSTNVAIDPLVLFNIFYYSNVVNHAFTTNVSHLMDGVVDLRVRAFNPQGEWIVKNTNNIFATNYVMGEVGLYAFYSNALPASAEVELGILEDRTLQRAESLSGVAQLNYFSNHVGQVHVFRQRAWIRNVDPSAYQ